ncbi:helix-turn-helix transcriptional regulator [uncultured Flavonifractor sp.]|uniref:helix-turn-helix transcriptional regulator n=1 Tax=uncultured Flavonifractor sp. TaxID=1193534 RepID=UPI00261D78B6|nr:helix-turn-helix transcriptional regulator [uncultured Flavonifractor sp.]
MTLSEKIQYYRKENKLSQEELAARVGVSRQAVSKWELGDATPEVDKLMALARAFGVTTDELLSPEEPKRQAPPPEPEPRRYRRRSFGGIEELIRRYGWLAGVYIALSGAGITLVGGLARFAFGRMFQVTVGDYFGGTGWDMMLPEQTMDMSMGVSSMGEVFLTFAAVILAVGLILMAGGAILAVVLYRKGRKGD